VLDEGRFEEVRDEPLALAQGQHLVRAGDRLRICGLEDDLITEASRLSSAAPRID
jgi:hypothetical protein